MFVIRIGPAGWTYKDWSGIVYPQPKPRGFDPLTFLAGYFDVLEINSSFYGAPRATTTRKWLDSVMNNKNFRFTAKLWRGFTHTRTATEADEREFKEGMNVLLDAARLGAVLMQFPWSFRNDAVGRTHVAQLVKRFREYPLVLEVRHGTWAEAGALSFLQDLGIGMCNIDQPLFKNSLGPSAVATSTVGYVRLHGRNYQTWFKEQNTVEERYDYLYSAEELEPWATRAQVIAEAVQDTYVVTNNHYLGKAVANAAELVSILTARPLNAPPSLIQRYPDLARFAGETEGPEFILT